MPVIITAKRNGFRRCGLAHPDKAITHPDGTFTAEQLAILQAEPMLVVHVVPAPAEAPAGDKKDAAAGGEETPGAGKALDDMTKVELAAWLVDKKVPFPTAANKAELLALAQAKAAEENKPAEGAAE